MVTKAVKTNYEAVLDDIGGISGPVRGEVIKYLSGLEKEAGELEKDSLNLIAGTFVDGYEAAVKRMKLIFEGI